ncbi:MAG: hypothetical protein KF900_14095 [Bacteroidetes bacterium]|nr:hypothetical protein [Bacteroidota bacterium]
MYADSKLNRNGDYEYSLHGLTRNDAQILHDICKAVYIAPPNNNAVDTQINRVIKCLKDELELTKPQQL